MTAVSETDAMANAAATDEAITKYVEEFCRVARLTGGRARKMTEHVKALDKQAALHGLSEANLSALLDLIFTGSVDDTTSKRIVKLLFPRHRVPLDAAVRIASFLSTSQARTVALLKWLVLVYEVIEDRSSVRKLYGIFFHFLVYETLRLELQRRFGGDSNIHGLLSVYKCYQPSVVLSQTEPGHSKVFRSPDANWEERFRQLQARWKDTLAPPDPFMPLPLDIVLAGKRRKTGQIMVPETRSDKTARRKIMATEISSFDELLDKIDRLELPDQMASVLNNRVLQHLVACDAKGTTMARISHWLSQCLTDAYCWKRGTPEGSARMRELLLKALSFTEFTKELLPAISEFLILVLTGWNGYENSDIIFRLLSYTSIREYRFLNKFYFTPLSQLFYVATPEWKAMLISCYTQILRRWAKIDWEGYMNKAAKDLQQLRKATASKALDPDERQVTSTTNDHLSVQHAVLSFYELTSMLFPTYGLPMFVTPSATTLYRCFLANNAAILSRTLGVMAYRHSLAIARNHSKLRQWRNKVYWKHIQAVIIPQNADDFDRLCTNLEHTLWNAAADKSAVFFGMPVYVEMCSRIENICSGIKKKPGDALFLTQLASLSSLTYEHCCLLQREALLIKRTPNCPLHLADADSVIKLRSSVKFAHNDFRPLLVMYLKKQGLEGLWRFMRVSQRQSFTRLARDIGSNVVTGVTAADLLGEPKPLSP
ncbi:Mis6-domain-containing protein [Thamnocephalis sphaerospora]|uniref:Mis6-domain-containing protein n=1 Tax=Thamnocephalis sphaerospora TaxID=78915 RepID=A0A4P9XWR5_9FUNG|nr:Mis6-domain-containing protein [Thamnocephalis sphaerospora]|eukprot:RKP09860.1 Mis6-domain-containing protein [Thamnocephalis sphaerospora]